MKKHVIIMTGAALLSTSAFATKARMTALGQDSARGSQYLNDTRNVFRNAAHVNNTNNYVVTEWGTNANAEGGMFRDAGSFAYGLYFNNQIGDNADTATYLSQNDRLDLFFGGDAGVQWGVRLDYSKSKQDATNEQDSMGVGFGVLMGDISAYANLVIGNEATAGTSKYEGSGMNVGAAYKWNNLTFHADYVTEGDEETVAGNKTEFTKTELTIGAAQVHEISSTAMVFTALDAKRRTTEDKASGVTDERSAADLIAKIGFEADATSWLTWRGSISQNVFLNDGKLPNIKNSKRDTTSVDAGASLTFGKLMVDGRIGTTAAGVKDGILRLDDVMTQVAVSYWF